MACGGLGNRSIKAPANLELTVTDSNYETISVLGDKFKARYQANSTMVEVRTSRSSNGLRFDDFAGSTFQGENVEFKIAPKAGVQSKKTQLQLLEVLSITNTLTWYLEVIAR